MLAVLGHATLGLNESPQSQADRTTHCAGLVQSAVCGARALSAIAEILAFGNIGRKCSLKSKPRNFGENDGMFLTTWTSSDSTDCSENNGVIRETRATNARRAKGRGPPRTRRSIYRCGRDCVQAATVRKKVFKKKSQLRNFGEKRRRVLHDMDLVGLDGPHEG